VKDRRWKKRREKKRRERERREKKRRERERREKKRRGREERRRGEKRGEERKEEAREIQELGREEGKSLLRYCRSNETEPHRKRKRMSRYIKRVERILPLTLFRDILTSARSE
jgi:hypothetical protein